MLLQTCSFVILWHLYCLGFTTLLLKQKNLSRLADLRYSAQRKESTRKQNKKRKGTGRTGSHVMCMIGSGVFMTFCLYFLSHHPEPLGSVMWSRTARDHYPGIILHLPVFTGPVCDNCVLTLELYCRATAPILADPFSIGINSEKFSTQQEYQWTPVIVVIFLPNYFEHII